MQLPVVAIKEVLHTPGLKFDAIFEPCSKIESVNADTC